MQNVNASAATDTRNNAVLISLLLVAGRERAAVPVRQQA
jgi:hypothetical protein